MGKLCDVVLHSSVAILHFSRNFTNSINCVTGLLDEEFVLPKRYTSIVRVLVAGLLCNMGIVICKTIELQSKSLW